MSFTPFDEALLFNTRISLDLYDPPAQDLLASWCESYPIHTHLLAGPEGSGKTTLIRAYFTEERCRELAQEHALVRLCYFTSGQLHSDVEVFHTLIQAVKDCLLNLDDSPDQTRLEAAFAAEEARACYADVQTVSSTAQTLLERLIYILNRAGYSVCLVIDHFHQLTNSQHCAANTFSAMASLVENQHLSFSYIIITDLPVRVASKNYEISNFNRILLAPSWAGGIQDESVVAVLKEQIQAKTDAWQERRKWKPKKRFHFSDQELDTLWELAAGLPGVLRYCLKALYEYRELHPHDHLSSEEILQIALSGSDALMRHWIKYLGDGWKETFQLILEGLTDNEIAEKLPSEKDYRNDLASGGLIIRDPSNANVWVPVCPLFGAFLRRELNRPALKPEPPKSAAQNYYVYIINNPAGQTVVPGLDSNQLSEARFLELRSRLRQLQESLPTLQPADANASQADQALEQQFEQQISQLGDSLLPDINTSTLQNTPMEELDQRFREIRHTMGLDASLSDHFMESLSPMCQFYAKASLLVENHMNLLMPILEDYSAHLVMYAKCMEQCLRDTMYPLLRNNKDLRDYDYFAHYDNPGSKTTFGGMQNETFAMLGPFYYAINGTTDRLGRLCQDYNIAQPSQSQSQNQNRYGFSWTAWWKQFASKLYDAKYLRNQLHPATPNFAASLHFTKENLDKLRQDLFGPDGILYCCQVGRQLYEKTKDEH